MALYHYRHLDAQGRKRSGSIDAVSESEARGKLHEQGVLVTEMGTRKGWFSLKALKGVDLMSFTLQLSQLLKAGIPLYEALVALEEQAQSEKFHPILLSLCDQIKAGKSLSETMKSFPTSFDTQYTAMVAAGEASATLGAVLEQQAQHLKRRLKVQKQLATALIYPAILGCFAVGIIALLMGFVVPSMEMIFDGRNMNPLTSAVLTLSKAITGYWKLYLPLTAAAVTWAFFKLRSHQGKQWLERMVLRIPFLRTLATKAAVARFSRTMSTLQDGGVNMIDSLRIARKVMKNAALEEAVEAAEGKVIEGLSLSSQLATSNLIPKLVPRMLAVGEDSGNTTYMFAQIASLYEEDLERSLTRLTALAQPIILLIMGVLVGIVMLSVLLPLTDISSLGL